MKPKKTDEAALETVFQETDLKKWNPFRLAVEDTQLSSSGSPTQLDHSLQYDTVTSFTIYYKAAHVV